MTTEPKNVTHQPVGAASWNGEPATGSLKDQEVRALAAEVVLRALLRREHG